MFYKKCVGATNYLLYVNLLILLPLIKSNASFHVSIHYENGNKQHCEMKF